MYERSLEGVSFRNEGVGMGMCWTAKRQIFWLLVLQRTSGIGAAFLGGIWPDRDDVVFAAGVDANPLAWLYESGLRQIRN